MSDSTVEREGIGLLIDSFILSFIDQVIDLLVKLLQCALREGDEEGHMIRIFKEAYDVLHAYMIGKSRKNALYFAKYIDFFQTQFTQKVSLPPSTPALLPCDSSRNCVTQHKFMFYFKLSVGSY